MRLHCPPPAVGTHRKGLDSRGACPLSSLGRTADCMVAGAASAAVPATSSLIVVLAALISGGRVVDSSAGTVSVTYFTCTGPLPLGGSGGNSGATGGTVTDTTSGSLLCSTSGSAEAPAEAHAPAGRDIVRRMSLASATPDVWHGVAPPAALLAAGSMFCGGCAALLAAGANVCGGSCAFTAITLVSSAGGEGFGSGLEPLPLMILR